MNKQDYLAEELGNKRELLTLFKRNSDIVIFDIGACDGLESIKYQKLFPNSKVYCFEPIPENVNEIETNFEEFGMVNAKIENLALSEGEGIVNIYKSSGNPKNADKDWNYGNKSSSLLEPDEVLHKTYPWLQFNNKIEVKSESIYSYTTRNHIDTIDFAHIDVQGAELQILKGATTLVQNINSIWLEVSNESIYKGQPLRSEIELFLRNAGFYKVKDTSSNKIYGDQFWVNRKYLPKLFYFLRRLIIF